MEVSHPASTAPTPPTPSVDFLDKHWKWPELMLMIVELLGASLEKSSEDLSMPEGYVLDCLKRNSRLELLKDAEYVIWALEHCGILMHSSHETLKFVYHDNIFGLNQARSDLQDWDISGQSLPSSGDLIPFLIFKLASVHGVHSMEFLEYVDASAFLSFIDFDDDLISGEGMEIEKKCVARKMLVDLLYLLRTHVGLLGVHDVSEMNKFYFAFKNKKVTIPYLEGLLERLKKADPAEQVALSCISLLRWTLTGDMGKDEAILKKAIETVLKDPSFVKVENDKLFLPRFFSSLAKSEILSQVSGASQVSFYDIHVVPY